VTVAVVYKQFTEEVTETLSADISFIGGAMLRQNIKTQICIRKIAFHYTSLQNVTFSANYI
jgi:hypothetical protein